MSNSKDPEGNVAVPELTEEQRADMIEEAVAAIVPKDLDPEQAKEARERITKMMTTKWDNYVTVEYVAEDGGVTSEKAGTGVVPTLRAINKISEGIKDTNVGSMAVYMHALATEDAEAARHAICEGTPAEVLKHISDGFIHPNTAMHQLSQTAEALCQRAGLKGIIVTAVFDGAQPAGFSYLTAHDELTHPDMSTLIKSGKEHVDCVRDVLKKKHPFLRLDDGKDIIIP